MKRFISLSLLAIMLSACIIQPASAGVPNPFARGPEDKTGAFVNGVITGIVPVMGQFLALLRTIADQSGLATTTKNEDISFATGHAVGMVLWIVPLYLASQNNPNK